MIVKLMFLRNLEYMGMTNYIFLGGIIILRNLEYLGINIEKFCEILKNGGRM